MTKFWVEKGARKHWNKYVVCFSYTLWTWAKNSIAILKNDTFSWCFLAPFSTQTPDVKDVLIRTRSSEDRPCCYLMFAL